MRKIIALCLVLLMLSFVVGCKDSSDDEQRQEGQEETTGEDEGLSHDVSDIEELGDGLEEVDW